MNCPRCSSEDTQNLPVIYAGGTHHITTTGRGAYFGAHGQGVGLVTTYGQSQSALAAACAPPIKKPIEVPAAVAAFSLFPALFPFLGGVTANTLFVSMMFVVFFSPIWGVALYISIKREKYNKKVWPNLFKHWSESWFCRKCGAIYHSSH